MEHQNQTSEVKRALQEKVLLDDGRVGYVFSELVQIGPSNRWHCHVCSRTVDSERALVMHLSHPLHTTKLRANKHPAKNFKKFADNDDGSTRKNRSSPKSEGVQNSWEMITDVLPGEPVPPGMEDVVEGVCQIQAKFDEHPGPLIGLEYIVELVTSEEESEPRYICLLCEKKGDPRSLMVHVTSQNHCLKYISCFFRTAGNALNMIPRTVENRKGVGIAIMKVAQEIEKNYGRLKPTSAVAETFSVKKYEILRQIDEKEHFRETPSTTFANLVTPEKIHEYCLQEDDFEPLASSAPKSQPRPVVAPNSKDVKPVLKPTNIDKAPVKTIKTEKLIELDDPIEVTSSLSSISPSLDGSDDERRDNNLRRSSSHDRYIHDRKRHLSPDSDDRRKFIYQGRRVSPPSRNLRGLRSRSRSRDRDFRRRLPADYYRERDRSRRSPSYGRSRGRSRFEDKISEERYRRKSPDRLRYERDRDRQRDRKRRGDSRSRDRRSRSRGDSRSKGSSRGRTLSRGRHSPDRSRSRDKSSDRKKDLECKWDKYRAELHKLELSFDTKLKYYEERPEKHPKYSEEWKTFWNKRYKEIQLSGKDPTTYDFKPEWIIFWAKRMKELNDEDFNREREQLKKKMLVEEKPEKPPSSDLQDISPPTPESQKDVTVDNIKSTWKALTGTEITAPVNQKKSNRSPSPWESTSTVSASSASVAPTHSATAVGAAGDSVRSSISSRKPYDIAPPVLHCLRMLSVLEHQLGSLGPKVMELLSRALVLERAKYNSSMTLLKDVDIHIFFETVKEKIRGQLIAGIVMRNLVSASRAIIKAIESMLNANPPSPKENSSAVRTTAAPVQPARLPVPALAPASEPVQVPGIGMIDKLAVAQQIASALVAQGRTDVTQEELEDLINAVVGIAKASNANVTKNQSSAAFFSQLNIENSTAASHINEILSNMISSAQKTLGIENKKPAEVMQPVQSVVEESQGSSVVSAEAPNRSTSAALQSTDVNKLTNVAPSKEQVTTSAPPKASSTPNLPLSKDVSDDVLKDKLMKFSVLSRDEQQNLITLLKELETTQAARVENLRKYVSIGLEQMAAEKNKEISNKYGGRLSPFSSRIGGANPAPDDSQKTKQKLQMSPEKLGDDDDDDDDDDYSVEEVYKAASEKLFRKSEGKVKNENELAKKNTAEVDNETVDESQASFNMSSVDIARSQQVSSLGENIPSRITRSPAPSSFGLPTVMKTIPSRTSPHESDQIPTLLTAPESSNVSNQGASSRTLISRDNQSNTSDKDRSALPMLSGGSSPGLLPTPIDTDQRVGSTNIIDSMFGKNNPYQINLGNILGTQNDNFFTDPFKNNNIRNTDNLDGNNTGKNYFTDINSGANSNKNRDFRDNNSAAYDYNTRNVPPPTQQQNYSGYSELKPPPLFEDAQNSRLFNQTWKFGDMNNSQPNFQQQPFGRNIPPQQQVYFRGSSQQNTQSAYGSNYRQNF